MIRNSRTFDRALSLITLVAIVMASFPVFPRVAEAADTIFEDGFEVSPAFSNPAWTSDPQWGATGSSAHSGSKKAKVEGSATDPDVLETSIDTSDYENLTLSFWYRFQGLEADDSVVVEWYDGANWNNLESFSGETGTSTDDITTWTKWMETLPAGAEDNSAFALRFTSDMNAGDDQFFLDDVLIEGEEIVVSTTTPVEEYFNGFESDTVDWQDNGASIVRTADGTDGVPSQCGDYHAVIDGNVFTRWGGYADEFPVGGYTTEVDVYLDTDLADGVVDDGFDFSSAVNGTDGNHRRDFIFHLETSPTTAGVWLVNASNNAPGNPSGDMDSAQITETGWYTLQADFHDNGSGVLEVTMNVIKRSDSSVIFTEDRSDPSDIIGTTVGGNRYGWFASPRFDLEELAIDNAALYLGAPEERSCASDVPDTEVLEDVLVTPSDLIEAADVPSMYNELKSWFFYNDETDTIDNTLGSFVDGPDTAPLGDGSVEISVTGTQRRNLATYQFSGTKLADITELEFSTYNPSTGNGGSSDRSAYLNFNVDFTGADTWQKRLAFVPSVNGSVSQDDWQEWDAIDGGDALWCWSGMTGCGGSASSWPVQTGTPFTNPASQYQKWSDIVAAYPNIAVRTTDSWLGLRVGEPYNDGYTENIDKFVIGIDSGTTTTITTYDFDPEQTATVEICKMDEDQEPLDGWTLMLLGDEVETVNVPSTGTEVFSTNNLDGDYAFIANGSYIYRPGYTGSTTDAAYSMRTDGNDPIDPTGHPYDPWVRVNDFDSPWEGYLGITVDNELGDTDWGSIFNPLHEYALQYNGDGDPAGFKIVDSSYADNTGSLTVDIYEGYTDITGENGCVTFRNVPYGTYDIDEIMQDGWFNVSGLGEVTIDEEEETFNVVNTDEEPQPTSSVQICKIDESQNTLPGWTLMLLGEEIEDLEVPANTMAGVDSSSLEGGMSYLAHVSGTWLNNREPDNHVDAEYSTEDGWVTHMDGFTGYGENILELQVAENFMDWGDYNEDHEYTASFIPGTDGPVNFRIFDGNDPTPEASWYGDNSGSLDVTIEEGYADVTGENGCVTFENVPYGTYEIDEIMQEGWSNLSGLGEVVVDGEEEVFTVVNQTPLPPQMCSVTVVSDEDNEVVETADNAVLAWAHAAWTAVIDGADWIWGSEYVTDPTTTEVQTFVREFEWSGGIASSSLVIATDNYYEVYLNGDFVASSTEASLFTDANKDTIPVSSFIDVGNNTLEIKVTNLGVPGSSPTSNPAGLKYNLTIVSDETGEDCMFAPEADLEITRPETENQVLSGEYTFEAEYTDADDNADPVQWAIRAGTCTSGSGTVAGNVDSFNTPYLWNGASFSSTIDMSGWDDGEYCFVVNPTEDTAPYFRETRWFTLEHPEPTQCLIVSDTSTLVVENNDFAVETWDEHYNWTHDINGATWIWDEYELSDPEATTTRTFKETFTVTELGSSTLEIAADNTYTVYINGDQVTEHLNANNYQTPDEYDVTSFIDEGENELEIIVTNIGTEDSGSHSNPAGLLFRLEIETDGGQCLSTTEPEDGDEDPEPTPTYEVFGFAWNDDNTNDVKDGEEGYLSSVAVQITNGSTTVATTTDAGGRYYFMVEPGTWTLSAALSGWYLTYPNTATSTHEAVVVATTSGPYDFGLDANEAIIEDDGGSDRVSTDDDNNDDEDNGRDGIVAGTSTTVLDGKGGGIDIWEDLRNEIGGSKGGPFEAVLGATAEAQELDATTTPEVDDEATPTEDDEENTSSPWQDWLCDYLWLLPLLWIVVSALAYWRKESYEDPRVMFWTQIIFGVIGVIFLLGYMITGIPCAWIPSAIVAIGSAAMTYYGRE